MVQIAVEPVVMATKAQAKRNLEDAVAKLGGKTHAGAISGVSEQTIKNWLHEGNLNEAKAINVARFIRAARRGIEDFLVDV